MSSCLRSVRFCAVAFDFSDRFVQLKRELRLYTIIRNILITVIIIIMIVRRNNRFSVTFEYVCDFR